MLALFQLATGEPPAAAQPGLRGNTAWRPGTSTRAARRPQARKGMGIAVESTVERNRTTSVYFP